jgi:hypothetical protein
MNPKLIVIDGKTYRSVDEMPADVRQQYEQAMRSLKDPDGNRIPDVFEQSNMLVDKTRNEISDLAENIPGETTFANVMKIVVDGKQFNSIDDLPPDARAKYEQAMSALDANRNGMPDFLEGIIQVQTNPVSASTSFGTEPSHPVSRTPMPIESPTITPDTSNGWMLGLLAASILFLCLLGVVGAWYFFLR